MAFTVEFTNSQGARESQEVGQSVGLALLSRLERLGAMDISVRPARGQRLSLAEARAHFRSNAS
jgi:hypothetical protein